MSHSIFKHSHFLEFKYDNKPFKFIFINIYCSTIQNVCTKLETCTANAIGSFIHEDTIVLPYELNKLPENLYMFVCPKDVDISYYNEFIYVNDKLLGMCYYVEPSAKKIKVSSTSYETILTRKKLSEISPTNDTVATSLSVDRIKDRIIKSVIDMDLAQAENLLQALINKRSKNDD